MYFIKLERSPSRLQIVCELIGVFVATLLYAVVVIIGVYSWWGNPAGFGMNMSVLRAFERYQLTVSPVAWTHAA